MADLGGYFAVSYVAEHVLVDGLDAAYRVKWEDASGMTHWSADTAVGHLEAQGAFSVNKPSIALDGSANAVQVKLTGNGRFALTLGGVAGGGVFVEAIVDARLPILLIQENAWDKAVVDLSGFVLQVADLRLTWFDSPGGVRSSEALLDANARKALTSELARRAAPYLTFRLPTDQLWSAELALVTQGIPGSVILTPQIKLGGVRVLNGWLALGIEATSSVGPSHGNAISIGLPPNPPPPSSQPQWPQIDEGDNSLRLIIDPALLITYLTANAKLALRMAEGLHPNIHPDPDVQIGFDDDNIVVSATGQVDNPNPFPGTSGLTATVRIRPFIPRNTNTVYASVHPDIQVDAPWYLDVLAGIVSLFGVDVFAKLHRANQSDMAILFGLKVTAQVPDFGDLTGRIEGRRIVFRPGLVGVFGEASITSDWSGPPTDLRPKVVPAVLIRDRFLRLELDSYFSRDFRADPTWRVRYTVRRASNGTAVDTGTAWSGPDPFGDPVDLWDPANYLETSFNVDLAAERPPGTTVSSLTQPITVRDLFDRSHPYVRWRKTHFLTDGRGQKTLRLSAIHQTAIRKRCKFCDTGTGRPRATYVIEALDTLPAPSEIGFSGRLCRYCFPSG